MIRWEIEPRCNLKCKHCFVADTEYGCATTSLENGLSYLNKLHELGVRTVVFSTREPLLYDGLCRLIYEAKLLDMSVAIVTNGILLDDMELSRKLVESGVDEVFVSIEGITAASNDFIRGKGTLARVIRGLSNLERCTREGKKLVRLFIQMSINQLNMAEGSDMPEFFNVLPIDGLIISAIGASGNAAKNRDIILSQESDEYIACCKTIIEKYLELKTRNYILGFKSLSPYDIVLINHEYGTNFCPYLPGCSAMNGAYSLLPSGKIIPCISLKEELPSSLMIPSILEVEAKDYSSIFDLYLSKMRNELEAHKETCTACFLREWCCLCPAGLNHIDQLLVAKKACQKSLDKFLEMLSHVEQNSTLYYIDFSGTKVVHKNDELLLSRYFSEGMKIEYFFTTPLGENLYRLSSQHKSLSAIATELGVSVRDIIQSSALLISKGFGRMKKYGSYKN